MRGKGLLVALLWFELRITPAYAGKSETEPAVQAGRPDHPRVCGEKTHKDMTTEDNMGSPPRMRGKAPSAAQAALQMGITPAYAGKRAFSAALLRM